MSVTNYSDLLKDDGAFESLDAKLNALEAHFKETINAIKAAAKTLGPVLKEAMSNPVGNEGKIAQMSVEISMLHKEISKLKTEQKKVIDVKKKFIDLSNAEQKEIVATQEKTKELKKQTRLLWKEQVAGIGTLQKLRAEIARDEAALEKMALATNRATKEQRRASDATIAFSKQLKRKKEALKSAEAAIGRYNLNVGKYPKLAQAATVATRHLIAGFGIWQGIALGKSIFNEIKEVESLNLALKTVTRTTAEYNASQLFLRDIAQNYGIEVNRLTSSYIKFAASLKDTGITLVQGKGLFESVAKSSAVLGVSAEDTEGALKALGQILSKGKVQAEELRGQLGDRLPGVMQIVADVTGKTTAELDKMLKAGELLAVDVLPKLAKGFEKAYNTEHIKTVETLSAKTAQFSNAWSFLIRTIDEGNGVISRTFKTLTGGLTGVINLLSKVSKRSELKDTILGDNYFGAIAGGGMKAQIRINATIDEIIKSFEKLQKEATSKDFLEKINSEIAIYEKTLSQLEEKSKSGNLNVFDAAINEGEIDIILYQLQRLRMLTIEAKEAEKDRADEAKKYNEQIEKTYETETLLAIAAKLKKRQEDSRLGKMKEITQEHKFQAEDAEALSALYSEHELKILAIADAHKKAGESADRSKEAAEELQRILEAEKREQLFNDAREGVVTAINIIEDLRNAAHQRELQRLDDQADAHKENINLQRDRAEKGLKNTLAFEERELAKSEAKKQRLQDQKDRRDKISLYFNTLNSLIEGGADPTRAIFKAGAVVIASEAFAGSFEEGGITGEVIDANKGGSSKYGSMRNGRITGDSHRNRIGGIPVLVKGKEGIFNERAMGGFESPSQFNTLHNYMKAGGKFNDFVNQGNSVVRVVEKSKDKESLAVLKDIKKGVDNFEGIKIDSDLLSSIPQIIVEQRRQGQILREIYGSSGNKQGLSRRD